MEPVNFLVWKRPAVEAILECDSCDRFKERIDPGTCLVELNDASAIPIVRYYGKQRSAVTMNKKFVRFSKRIGGISPKIRFR